jgi:membrane protease subunit (stomatin/prohibitin family)
MALFGNKEGGIGMDVIRCDEPSYLIWKWRPSGEANSTKKENAIRYGSSLRVKDGEVAVFVYPQKDGTFQDFIEGPFDETIKAANFPGLASIVGLAFGGASPFQAEIYFINIAGINQIPFGVPYFNVHDYRPQFRDFVVPVAVRGKLTFKLVDYKAFIKLHRLINFNLDDFKGQIKSALGKYVKDVVAKATEKFELSPMQLGDEILEISNDVQAYIKPRMADEFGVLVSSVDIDEIEAAQDSEGYQKLMSFTRDIAAQTTQAQANVNIKNMEDTQRINAENIEETLRIQREEAQRAQKLQTEGANFAVHQLNQQADVAKNAADSLGKMGQAAGVSLGSGGGGFNPAGMMAGIAMGGVVGQQMAGMMGNMMQGMNQPNQPNQSSMAPPPPPQTMYSVAVNGQTTGPYNMQQLSQMAASGQFSAQSMVWKQGMAGWVAAGTIQELQSIFMAGSPPPPPPGV